ncbi:hypothetical protein C7M52_02761 [Mixta theicola]|nr:hypothetical protein C7M52_02761 [Mixta theicola]
MVCMVIGRSSPVQNGKFSGFPCLITAITLLIVCFSLLRAAHVLRQHQRNILLSQTGRQRL